MMLEEMTMTTRSTETSVDIAASADTVWRALTEPSEIVRWFALSADVVPGEGGTMLWRWQDLYVWPSRIEIWEPLRHLRLAYVQDSAADPKAPKPLGAQVTSGYELVVDFRLESRGSNATVLRVVHSGFGRDASWDDEYDGVARGWITELAALKHYAEHHFGTSRKGLWVFARTSLMAAYAWSRLVGGPADETRFVTRDVDDNVHARANADTPIVVLRLVEGSDVVAIVPSWNHALLRIWLDPVRGGTIANVFVSAYGEGGISAPTSVELMQMMRQAFPEEADQLIVAET